MSHIIALQSGIGSCIHDGMNVHPRLHGHSSCHMLMAAVQVLKSRPALAEEGHWVQLERHAEAQLQLDNSSHASTSFAAGYEDVACPQDVQEQGLQAAMVTAGAAGLQSRFSTDGAAADASQDPQSAIELLRMCQRTVSGTLDDVVGLE